MASAMMEHTKLEILKQAGQAMLAQANQDNSLALQLLQ
nr:flagellin [Lachnospiraceae bacterium]